MAAAWTQLSNLKLGRRFGKTIVGDAVVYPHPRASRVWDSDLEGGRILEDLAHLSLSQSHGSRHEERVRQLCLPHWDAERVEAATQKFVY